MERVGIPTFEARVSPVLDVCNRMLLVDIDNACEVHRHEISLEKVDFIERIEFLNRWGIHKIICSGVSDLMCKYLSAKNIILISGVVGEFENVITAYICGKLDDTCFSMPGKGHSDTGKFI
jgi:predicted Fe-Mo cluster-binding NifX family protein